MRKYVRSAEEISFQIISDEPKFTTNNNTRVAFQLTDDQPHYINTTDTLAFLLRDYDTRSIQYAIVLEFFNQTGGVF